MLADIPQVLQDIPQWVNWRIQERNGRPTKVPICPRTGNLASVTSADTWSDFETAMDTAMAADIGVGFVFTKDDPYVGIDLDHDIDMNLVEWFDSYTEKSQGGDGLHIIVKGTLLEGGRRFQQYEVYDDQRFFCMTGDVIHNKRIKPAQEKVDEFLQMFPERAVAPSHEEAQGEPAELDHDVLAMVRRNKAQGEKFTALYEDGNLDAYNGDHSLADAGLMSMLRFWTGGHREQSIRLFSASMLGQREKWQNRPDYQQRTWQGVNMGPVRDTAPATELRVPAFLRNAGGGGAEALSRSEVREVLDGEAREALVGTPLETMVQVFESVTSPPLPLQLTLPKAYGLAGGALTGRSANPLQSAGGGRGVGLAGVVIDTAGGQACNVYALTIAESASGKDIGGLLSHVTAKKGWHIGGTGSTEGFLDVLSAKPVAVMEIGEFQNWLDQRHWQAKAAPTVTDLFNKYWFEMSLSQRGENTQPRQSNYCALSIVANVQPLIMQRYSDRVSLDSGFLARFLLCECRDNTFRYPQKVNVTDSVALVESALLHYEQLKGRLHVDTRELFGSLVEEFVGAPFAPHWKRLINEYGPRLALMLTPQEGSVPRITEEGVRRASVLIRWHYHQALDVFSWFDQDDGRWEAFVIRVFKAIRKDDGVATKTSIARRVSGSKQQRERAIEELEERELISKTGRKYNIIETPREWR